MTSASQLPKTLGELRRHIPEGCSPHLDSVKDEMRRNLRRKLATGDPLFPGIIGYDETVIPQIVNAILAKHDFLLLGLRGQAKTRLVRLLVYLLDEYIPFVEGSPVHDNPFAPITKYARDLINRLGDDTPIAHLHRSQRYQEKLATPDVTIADLIGDIDPVKAVAKKLDFSDEEVIHYGIIPRTNRGIFAINELPDLQQRIQVGLLNIMEERDIQIRGFPVRLPLDLCIVYTANPEDYTNRGNIITPLKDRIDAQILTHYPERLDEAVSITQQEAWLDRSEEGYSSPLVPPLIGELVERTVFEARRSDYVDRNSGVSARMAITFLETVCSNVERRSLRTPQSSGGMARIHDLVAAVSAVTGKMELVYKGEQEGPISVAQFLVGRAVREAFNSRFVPNHKPGRETKFKFPQFQGIVDWFEQDNSVELTDDMTDENYHDRLESIAGLPKLIRDLFPQHDPAQRSILMEFVVEGLAQNFLLTKLIVRGRTLYADTVSHMMTQMEDD
jgi:magnesium chelatase subunit I